MRFPSALQPIGVLAGVCLAAVAAHDWQVTRASHSPGAGVTAEVGPTGQIDVAPAGRFLRADGMRPGDTRTGFFRVHNFTGDRQPLQLRITPSVRDLDQLLLVRVTAGRRELYRGPLGGLRGWSRAGHALSPTRTEKVSLQVLLPRGARDGWQSRRVSLSVELRSREAR